MIATSLGTGTASNVSRRQSMARAWPSTPHEEMYWSMMPHMTPAMRALLAGEKGPFRDIVLLNAAAALIVADKAPTLKDGVALAADAIDNGQAAAKLAALVQATGGTPA